MGLGLSASRQHLAFLEEIIAKDSGHLTEELKKKVYRDNAAALYGL